MESLPKTVLRRVKGSTGGVAYDLTMVQLTSCQAQETWVPSINAYRCRNEFLICADLAGVDRASMDVQVEPRRIWIRGQRQLPEPEQTAGPPLQVLALEIDHGPFAREIVLPAEVVPNQVQAEQRNGMLWISLPLRSSDG